MDQGPPARALCAACGAGLRGLWDGASELVWYHAKTARAASVLRTLLPTVGCTIRRSALWVAASPLASGHMVSNLSASYGVDLSGSSSTRRPRHAPGYPKPKPPIDVPDEAMDR